MRPQVPQHVSESRTEARREGADLVVGSLLDHVPFRAGPDPVQQRGVRGVDRDDEVERPRPVGECLGAPRREAGAVAVRVEHLHPGQREHRTLVDEDSAGRPGSLPLHGFLQCLEPDQVRQLGERRRAGIAREPEERRHQSQAVRDQAGPRQPPHRERATHGRGPGLELRDEGALTGGVPGKHRPTDRFRLIRGDNPRRLAS